MKYNGTIYRPPIEANTFLLPITEGCTHNSCSFCKMYQGIPFRMLSIPEVEDYLTETKHSYGRYCGRIQRVYLVGADPFALSARNLLERIDLIRKYLPNVKTITMYARTDNIASKSDGWQGGDIKSKDLSLPFFICRGISVSGIPAFRPECI